VDHLTRRLRPLRVGANVLILRSNHVLRLGGAPQPQCEGVKGVKGVKGAKVSDHSVTNAMDCVHCFGYSYTEFNLVLF
jgi:hypothetical protein